MSKTKLNSLAINFEINGQTRTLHFMYEADIEDHLNIDIQENQLVVNLVDDQIEETDPALSMYKAKMKSISGLNLIDKSLSEQKDVLMTVNGLDLSDINFNKTDMDFLCSADINLSCIRNLDVSCESGVGQEHDADSFLKKLFEVPSLRSLEVINVRNSNITIETLKILKNKDNFDSYLIRNSELVSYYNGWKLAPIYINQVENTPLRSASFVKKMSCNNRPLKDYVLRMLIRNLTKDMRIFRCR